MSAAKYGSSRQAFTVLIADDGLLERNMVKAIFQQQGHRVVLAADGMEALLVRDDNYTCASVTTTPGRLE